MLVLECTWAMFLSRSCVSEHVLMCNRLQVLDCLDDDNIIGRGGAGTVYKGVMPSGEIVAVKRLAGEGKGASHDHGFSAEIQTLGKIRHRNIVRLLGCCSNHETNLLVYEYMPHGSLGELLHSKERSANLDWETRCQLWIFKLWCVKCIWYIGRSTLPF